MKAKLCLVLNAAGVGICIGAGALAVDAEQVTALAGWLMTAGVLSSLAGFMSLFVVQPEVWP